MKKVIDIVFLLFLIGMVLTCSGAPPPTSDNGVPQRAFAIAEDSVQTSFYTGDGGRGMRIAVLAPEGKDLGATESWMPALTQGILNTNFNRYSAMTVIDRQNMDTILEEQKLSETGYYSEENYAKIGNVTNAQYILTGTILKTANSYSLQLAVSNAETAERRASYTANTTTARLENGAAVNEATLALLTQLGVVITDEGKTALGAVQSSQSVDAQTALAKGITAQKSGTVVEALSYYFQAMDYDPSLAEAAGRLNILSANVSSGNIGEDARNDIVWRRNWVARLTEAEQYYANYMKAPPPFNLVYATDLQPGVIDYVNETMPFSFAINLLSESSFFETVTKVINTVGAGLTATGRAAAWGLDWPQKTAAGGTTPFMERKGSFNVAVELINEKGVTIGRQSIALSYEWNIGFQGGALQITPRTDIVKTVTFNAVKADLITDSLSIKIAGIDGVAAQTASQSKRINIVTYEEYTKNDPRYKIGDKGPSGGIIFYDKLFYTNGWRYLEAAPADLGTAQWGSYGTYIGGTGTAIGTGKQNTNTQKIISALKTETNRAAQLCAAYRGGGKSDWFLPSKNELDLMYKNLKTKGLGGFKDSSYWSSSEYDFMYAWLQYFDDGSQDYVNKNNEVSVRPVRAF